MIQDLSDGVLAGDQRSIARAISIVETKSLHGQSLVRALFGRGSGAKVIGITGAPGVGKSTLVDCLTVEWRRRSSKVGILAVDPTSPFSGGAILGDRIRMQTHFGDDGVYVRSMATRGYLGGLADATIDSLVILDAAGMDIIIVETVGVGQGEVDIARTADVSIVVTVPGTGDDVQAIKAGIMEIGDIFVVNKSDRQGADRAVGEIESALALKDYGAEEWRPPVFKTIAASGSGVGKVLDAAEEFTDIHREDGRRVRGRAEVRLREVLTQRLLVRLEESPEASELIENAVGRIILREIDPYSAADEIMERLL